MLIRYPGAIIAARLLGHRPELHFSDGIDDGFIPVGPWTDVTNHFRREDTLLILARRTRSGATSSCVSSTAVGYRQVALLATIGAMLIGTIMGAVAGYYPAGANRSLAPDGDHDGVPGAAHHRDGVDGRHRLDITFGGLLGQGGVYPCAGLLGVRLVLPGPHQRAKVLSLREKEFVEAAFMTGASDWRIISSHLLPHLIAPIIVLDPRRGGLHSRGGGALVLGVGDQLPTAGGNLLSSAPEFYTSQPWLMLWRAWR